MGIEKYNEEAWKYFSSTFHLAPIIKEKQDSIKFNLLKNLKNKHAIKDFNI